MAKHAYHKFHRTPNYHPLKLAAMFAHKLLNLVDPLPALVDHRPDLLPIRDQDVPVPEGACTGFSEACFDEQKTKATAWRSPPYIYAKARQAEGSFPADSGACIGDGMGCLQAMGICAETLLPFTGNPAEAPTPECDADAAANKITQPLQVDWSDSLNVKRVLASGRLIVIGFVVYQEFENTGPDGMVPETVSGDPLGGHAVVVCGFDDTRGVWIIRNSWGTGFGDGGYCFMKYGYEQYWTEAWTAQ